MTLPRIAIVAFAVSICTLVTGSFSRAAVSDQEALVAMGLCSEMEGYVNSLVDFSTTKCIPEFDKLGVNFIFVTEKPLFSVESAKKAWLITVVGAYGKTLSERGNYKVDSLYLADAEMAKVVSYQTMKGSVAKELSRKVRAGEIDLNAMYARILSSL